MRWLAALTATTAMVALAITGFSTNSPGAEPTLVPEPALVPLRVATFAGPFCRSSDKPGRTHRPGPSRPLGNIPVRIVGGPPGHRINKKLRTGPGGLTGVSLGPGAYEVRPGPTRDTRRRSLGPRKEAPRFVELTEQEVRGDVIFVYSPPQRAAPEIPGRRQAVSCIPDRSR